jgi:hypothetical protein
MLKHGFYLALAIAVGLAVAKMFGGTFNLASLFGGTTTTTAPCWLAAVAFNEDFETGPRVNRVRRHLLNFEKQGRGERALVNLYRQHGERMAALVSRSRVAKFVNAVLFRRVLRAAQAV